MSRILEHRLALMWKVDDRVESGDRIQGKLVHQCSDLRLPYLYLLPNRFPEFDIRFPQQKNYSDWTLPRVSSAPGHTIHVENSYCMLL